ncbi:MAG: SPASM domain-containing protein [Alkaliphilus sp.]
MDVSIAADEVIALKYNVIESNKTMLIRPNGDVKFDCLSPFRIGNIKEKKLIEIGMKLGKTT